MQNMLLRTARRRRDRSP